ncbi:MAG TPA: SIS domain-containing protein [Pirellulales bacterium]|jgi:D-sedoheptulose 7-phosphate isomerase|nr:SIS domain-containing protein [Pirellulales bacterium]
MTAAGDIAAFVRDQLAERNRIFAEYVPRHCQGLARASQEMARRFGRGGRLLAVGTGSYATDAAHISVEFIHPVIVGKRALPALDLSVDAERMLDVLTRPDDVVMSFGPPEGNAGLDDVLAGLRRRGALVCQWPGRLGDYPLPAATSDPFIHQEVTELMYHALWETVHVFFEQKALGDDVGASAFLYPFLGAGDQTPADTLADVARSIAEKGAEDARLRNAFAATGADTLAAAVLAVHERVAGGGTLLAFGNGGSATDANDLVLDCVDPPPGMRPIPAISLSLEPANISAIANDVGVELVFMRQLIAGGRPGDVAVAISTSGTSKNVCAGLVEARKRGMLTIGLLGGDGGDILRGQLADFSLVVHCDYIPRIQEVQASIYHVFRQALAGPG